MSEYWDQPWQPGGAETYEAAKERYGKLIKQSDIDHWKKHGYVVIERLFSPAELEVLHKGLQKYMPTWEDYRDHRPMFAGLSRDGDIPLRGSNAEIVRREFPFEDDALNNAGMHPFLCAFAERVRGANDLLLTHNAIVGKYAGKGDYDQAMHTDHPHNTPVVPVKGMKYCFDMPMIIYHSDVTLDLGPTYVVSWEDSEPQNLIAKAKKTYTRQELPALYEKERALVVPAGSVIIYTMRTWHRGSAMTAKEGARFTQFTGFHASSPWVAPTNQMNTYGNAKMDRFMIRSDPGQRTLVGFPPVGHEYWSDQEAIDGVASRYPEMDMRPYGGGPPKALKA